MAQTQYGKDVRVWTAHGSVETIDSPAREWPPSEGNKVAVRDFSRYSNLHKIFDPPDQANFPYKAMIAVKYGATVTLFAGVTDYILNQRTGYFEIFRTARVWGVPLIGGALVYTSSVAITSNLFNHDGYQNHAFAGALTGSSYGAFTKSVRNGFLACIVVMGVGMLYKCSKNNGFDVFQQHPTPQTGFPWSNKMDYTMTTNYPGYWVRKPLEDDEVVNE